MLFARGAGDRAGAFDGGMLGGMQGDGAGAFLQIDGWRLGDIQFKSF